MAGPLIRKDAWKLSVISTWEPTLLWYAKAVGEMSTRPPDDPTSWRYQGGVHGYNPGTDPLIGLGQVPQSVQDQFFGQCQHGTWFFLPWHRMYLGFFEQIVRATIVALGGPADWTLPYWNYGDTSNPNAKTLPPCFRTPTLPDGSPNPLFVIGGVNVLRAPGINAGNSSVIPDQDVDFSGCLGESFFAPDTDTTSGDLGFGGPATGSNHDAQVFGQQSVESLPHNQIHVDVGGEWQQGGKTLDGWMINPDTAALDPIFWFHHCNVDRLWAVWNKISPSNTGPNASVNVAGQNIAWATSVPFTFFDATKSPVTMTPSQVTNPTTTPFAYDYDDTSNPLAAPILESVEAPRSITMKPKIPAMVGASDQGVTLTGTRQSTAFAVQAPRAAAATLESVEPEKTYLKLENVMSRQSHATYEVFVNLPDNPDAEAYQEHHAGSMPLFGVRQASTPSARHAGNGLNFSLDITKLVDRLKAQNAWDERNIRVTFEPRKAAMGAGLEEVEPAPTHEPIRVGRVSLYKA